tara:strand:+ start:1544 stop:2980 length:1437 start_codon:yes stop_codon:yes gene_type:complete
MTHSLRTLPLLLSACILLNACTADRIELGSSAHSQMIELDRQNVLDQDASEQISLSYAEALKRAIAHNLDARVSALEMLSKEDDIDIARLEAIPNLNITSTRYGRSNAGASSSRSIVTGRESLEPSFSTERYHDTSEISVNWNILNFMLAVANSRIAKDETLIAQQRHEKVLQNIERDVHAAYWRAYAYQRTTQETKALIAEADQQLRNITKADQNSFISASKAASLKQGILQQLQALKALDAELTYADIELKSLLSIPQKTKIILTSKPNDQDQLARSLLQSDIEALEKEALYNRPEVKETVLQKNIDAQNTRNTILRTMPGAELFFASNRDSNQFLYDQDWLSFSASLSQSLSALFTLPARHRAAKNIETLGEARRLSLIAAIMAQVHLAQRRLDITMEDYKDAKRSSRVAAENARKAETERKQGLSSGNNSLPIILQAQQEKIKALQMHAEMQDALSSLLNTLGRPLHRATEAGS